jgi:hypothetical protein
MLAQMHQMLHFEHITMASGADADSFRDEVAGARSRYNNCGRLWLPWLKWVQQKTAVDAYREAMERRRDPAHLAKLTEMQAALDAEAKHISDSVAAELELRKAAGEYREKLKLQDRQQRRRHGRVPRRRHKPATRR